MIATDDMEASSAGFRPMESSSAPNIGLRIISDAAATAAIVERMWVAREGPNRSISIGVGDSETIDREIISSIVEVRSGTREGCDARSADAAAVADLAATSFLLLRPTPPPRSRFNVVIDGR